MVKFVLAALAAVQVHAKEIETNAVTIANAPEWLMRTRVEKIIDRMQTKLEWTIRKSKVFFYSSPEEYDQAHHLGQWALAVTVSRDGTSVVHMGPNINTKNFDEVFGHELVHVIIKQKYSGAIPGWLEEGLANHLAKADKVDYKWLAKQPQVQDVTELAHPFGSRSAAGVLYRYKASQALAEMLSRKCDLENLIRLSVERKMEDYIKTYCEINDLNKAFADWVAKRK